MFKLMPSNRRYRFYNRSVFYDLLNINVTEQVFVQFHISHWVLCKLTLHFLIGKCNLTVHKDTKTSDCSCAVSFVSLFLRISCSIYNWDVAGHPVQQDVTAYTGRDFLKRLWSFNVCRRLLPMFD